MSTHEQESCAAAEPLFDLQFVGVEPTPEDHKRVREAEEQTAKAPPRPRGRPKKGAPKPPPREPSPPKVPHVMESVVDDDDTDGVASPPLLLMLARTVIDSHEALSRRSDAQLLVGLATLGVMCYLVFRSI